MPLLAALEPSVCAICCGLLANDPIIPTTCGDVVHIHCAEGQAHRAARRRTARVALSAVMLFVLLTGAAIHLPIVLCVALTVLLIAAHVQMNRRWWHYTVQSARLWWRWR